MGQFAVFYFDRHDRTLVCLKRISSASISVIAWIASSNKTYLIKKRMSSSISSSVKRSISDDCSAVHNAHPEYYAILDHGVIITHSVHLASPRSIQSANQSSPSISIRCFGLSDSSPSAAFPSAMIIYLWSFLLDIISNFINDFSFTYYLLCICSNMVRSRPARLFALSRPELNDIYSEEVLASMIQ